MPTPIPQPVQDMMVQATEAKAAVEKAAARKQAAVQALIAATAEDDAATDELAKTTGDLHTVRRAARALGFTMLEVVMPTAGFGAPAGSSAAPASPPKK